jgi:DNA mismatch repair ATPase MutL
VLRKFINESYLQLSLRSVDSPASDEPSEAGDGPAATTIQDADAKMIFKKYAMFVLDISCPSTEYDVTLDPTKTLIEFKVLSTYPSLYKVCIITAGVCT